MFKTPLEVYGDERLASAYRAVTQELEGEHLSPELFATVMPSFIDALGDSKRAGKLLANALSGGVWDWPRWYPFARGSRYTTVKAALKSASGVAQIEALGRVHRDMGAAVASRVAAIALHELTRRQRCDPDYVAIRPNWEFVCHDGVHSKAPAKCRALHCKVLPVDKAMKAFPAMPCARLDCQCEVFSRGAK